MFGIILFFVIGAIVGFVGMFLWDMYHRGRR